MFKFIEIKSNYAYKNLLLLKKKRKEKGLFYNYQVIQDPLSGELLGDFSW